MKREDEERDEFFDDVPNRDRSPTTTQPEDDNG
jgi:hypothetical protein